MFCATFISLMFLHGNSDFASLLPFFPHLRGQLLDAPSSPVFGSDDDKAQSKAIDEAFPNVKRITCTRHLKENIQRHLWDTVGCSMADKQRIIQQIFGPKGMCYGSDPVTLDIRQQNVLNVAEVVSQQDDLKRALIGIGNYQFAKGYKKFELQPFVWVNKSPEQKKTLTDS